MNSFIPWIGGKRSLRKRIIEFFPNLEERKRYVEVFGGAAWVLFGIAQTSKMEVYNDINADLINLFRVIKYHHKTLQEELSNLMSSRELFFDYKEQLKIRGLTDIQRAARFYVLLKLSFGANRKDFILKARNFEKSVEDFEKIAERLNKVVIENLDYERCIKLYDRVDTLFYLDPPYYKTEFYYEEEFKKEEHEKLRDVLKNIKGKFILSYNDCEEIRDLYKDYKIIETSRQHNLGDVNGKYKELIIKNF